MTALIVYGANGRTGHPVVRKALEAGHTVTAGVRDPDAFADFVAASPHRDRLTVRRVDVLNAASTAASAVGQEAAISAVGGGRKPNHLLGRSARNLVNALTQAGVHRFECISSGAADEHDPSVGIIYGRIISPLFMREVYADVRDMEAVVQASTLDWTLVRPAYLTDKPARDRWRTLDHSTPRRGWRISRVDLASFLVDQLNSPEWIHRHPTLAW